MYLPLAEYDEPRTKKMIIDFKGYNNTPVPNDGQYISGQNISSNESPCLSPREPRETMNNLVAGTALGSSKELYWVDGTSFVYDGVVKGTVTAGEKQFLNFNDFILIWPDKKYYDTAAGTFSTIPGAVPDMDFIAEHENRVWGCKGSNVYASKLGDFKEWNSFLGNSTDSYATDVGSGGDFTGILWTSTHLVFSKEKCFHKLFGSKPSNFEVGQAIPCDGVQAGCHKSIVNVNGTVFYKAIPGIMSYAGGLPNIESIVFGSKKYTKAIAGSNGQKYYCSLYDGNNYILMVMDTWQQNRWDIEDNLNVNEFTFYNNSLYALSGNKVIKFNSGTENIITELTTGLIYETIKEKIGMSNISVLAELETGSSLSVYLRIDNGNFELMEQFTSTGFQSFVCSVRVQRAHHFQIKLVCTGKFKIYALEREFVYLSEV